MHAMSAAAKIEPLYVLSFTRRLFYAQRVESTSARAVLRRCSFFKGDRHWSRCGFESLASLFVVGVFRVCIGVVFIATLMSYSMLYRLSVLLLCVRYVSLKKLLVHQPDRLKISRRTIYVRLHRYSFFETRQNLFLLYWYSRSKYDTTKVKKKRLLLEI